MSRFRPLRGRLWGVCNTPLRSGTCDPSKYRCNSPTGYVRPFEKPPRFCPLRGRGVGVCDTPLRPGTYDPSKYRCDPPTGYVRGFKKWICIRHRRWRIVGRMRYAPTTGYVRFFEIPMQFSNRVCAIFRNTDAMPQPGTCEGSKNGSVYATNSGVW